MKNCWLLLLAGVVVMGMAGPARSADWRFPVGLSYISGIHKVVDLYEENYQAEGYATDVDKGLSVGVSFSPYVQFDSGWAVGGLLGPVEFISGDADFFDLPVGLDVRSFLFPKAAVSPYLRAGVKYHLASGDFVNKSIPGLFGGVGLEFMRTSRVGIACEFLYDSSEVEFDEVATGGTRKIKPAEYMVSLQVVF